MKYLICTICGVLIGSLITYLFIRKFIKAKVNRIISEIQYGTETTSHFLGRYISESELNDLIAGIKSNLSTQIYARISDLSVGKSISHLVCDRVSDKAFDNSNETTQTDHRGFLKSAMQTVKHMVKEGAEMTFEAKRESIENWLSDKINEVIRNNGKEIVSDIVGKEVDKIFAMPISKLFEGNENMILMMKQRLNNLSWKELRQKI